MKRIFTILLAIILLLSLTSCKDSEIDSELDNNLIAGMEDTDETSEYALTIASYGTMTNDIVVYAFEKEYGISVRTISYSSQTDLTELNTKLMAKDDDIDIFMTPTLNLYAYLQTGYFVDLAGIESLKSRIDSCDYAKAAVGFDGQYFGIPLFPNVVNTEHDTALMIYRYDYLDLPHGVYSDPDGEALYMVLKDMYDTQSYYGSGTDSQAFYEIVDQYLVISPYSKNQELAAKFMEIMFDFCNGQITIEDAKGNEISCYNTYPDISDKADVRPSWIFSGPDIIQAFPNADDVLSCDGSEASLRKMAEDTARNIRFRLQG